MTTDTTIATTLPQHLALQITIFHRSLHKNLHIRQLPSNGLDPRLKIPRLAYLTL